MSQISEDIAQMQKNIKPLNINGLKGRVLTIKGSKKTAKKNLLMVYGHHASLERMYGVAQVFADYGTVTAPDLPGFGGMDSFYTIGMKPTLDNLADYLATFVKLRYRTKKITIVGTSLGFVIATRMLQRYPDLVNKVDVLISMVGFSHHSDFVFSQPRKLLYRTLTYILSKRVPAWFFYNLALHPTVVRALYGKTPHARSKFKEKGEDYKKRMLNFEAYLWRANDVRTHFYTNYLMFVLNNCDKQVKMPVHHIVTNNDQYFDRSIVEQHLRVIFTNYHEYVIKSGAHAPSLIATKDEAKVFVPDTLSHMLKKNVG